jgi:hypothetical protein
VVNRSKEIFGIILSFQIFFAYIGYVNFHDSDAEYFTDLWSSYFNIFVLFTLSNYPSIQVPYYAENQLSFFFFLVFILVGLYLFLNLLFAVLFSNYKIVNEQATQKHKENVDKYFQGLFTDFDWENNGFIDTDSLTDALGGKSIIQADPRIEKILDQTRVINDSMISAEDLKFILTYTATQKLQKTYITRL